MVGFGVMFCREVLRGVESMEQAVESWLWIPLAFYTSGQVLNMRATFLRKGGSRELQHKGMASQVSLCCGSVPGMELEQLTVSCPPRTLVGLTQSCGIEANWAFMSCPPENECLNGHHDCNETQNCNDLPHGYKCTCKNGYMLDK